MGLQKGFTPIVLCWEKGHRRRFVWRPDDPCCITAAWCCLLVCRQCTVVDMMEFKVPFDENTFANYLGLPLKVRDSKGVTKKLEFSLWFAITSHSSQWYLLILPNYWFYTFKGPKFLMFRVISLLEQYFLLLITFKLIFLMYLF